MRFRENNGDREAVKLFTSAMEQDAIDLTLRTRISILCNKRVVNEWNWDVYSVQWRVEAVVPVQSATG